VFDQRRSDLYEWTVEHGCRVRGTSDLYWAERDSQMHVQDGSRVQFTRRYVHQRIDPGLLLARFAGLLLPIIGCHLYQWSLQRRRRCGIVLHKRWCGWDDVSVEYEPSDMYRRDQWLHRLHHLDMHQRSLRWRGWLGILLHERLYDWGNSVFFGHEPRDVHAWS